MDFGDKNGLIHTYSEEHFESNELPIQINANYSPAELPAPTLLQSVSELVDEEETHCHWPRPPHNKKARNQLAVVMVLCLGFMACEIVGGVISGSLALLTDATHLASDIAGLFISLFSIWLAKKPASSRMSFGFYRAEVIGALFSVFLIWILTGILCYMAVRRIVTNSFEIKADEMLITASLGVFFNIVMGAVLHLGLCCKCDIPHGHSHGGGGGHQHHNHNQDSHGDASVEHKKSVNINVRAAFIHIIGDFIQSIGVLIAAIIIKIEPAYKLADPICTFVFSILVLITTFTVMRDVLMIFMEAVPRGVNYRDIKESLQSLESVRLVHSLHVWSLTMDKVAVVVHLAIDTDQAPDWNSLVKRATKLLRDRHGVFQCNIQVELYQEKMSACTQCETP